MDDDDPMQGGGEVSSKLQEFFLPVHGYVRLRPEEVAIVNHPAFQRLRVCRQLGFAHLVFPGAVHTRFEHSIGAVYVADKIVQYVNSNFKAAPSLRNGGTGYDICEVDSAARSFIRLGALLHDIGHIPFGHTLEDELEHLEKHDGEDRVDMIAKRTHGDYFVDGTLELNLRRPEEGWTLEALINAVYQPVVDTLFTQHAEKLQAYEIVKLTTLKPPAKLESRPGKTKDHDEQARNYRKQLETWKANGQVLGQVLPLAVCRDIIGNTICADFLDYLFRDWYHVGKPMTEDRRLYQYMEVRTPKTSTDKAAQQFVINVGPDRTLRHDALTSIFELLEGRYKLAETVLFHRTKLAMTALLDRCFLELRFLYEQVGLTGKHGDAAAHLGDRALELLLESSDDKLPEVIRKLAHGVDEDRKVLERARERHSLLVETATSQDEAASSPRLKLEPVGTTSFDALAQTALIEELSRRIEDRTMYTLACRLSRRRLDTRDKKRNQPEILPDHLRLLATPERRHKQILMLESLLNLPPGSVTMYAPSSAKMNAKIAQVKLLIDNQIKSFSEYEKERGDDALTGGVLAAQVRRFYELWGVSIYINRPQWHLYEQHASEILGNLEHFLKSTIYIKPDEEEERGAQVIRDGFQQTIDSARRVAARAHSPSGGPVDERSTASTYSTEQFVSRLPYSRSRTY